MRPLPLGAAGLLALAGLSSQAQPVVIDNDEAARPATAPSTVNPERRAAATQLAMRQAEGKAVREVRVLGRWASGLPLPIVPCEALTAERTFAVMEAVRAAMKRPDDASSLASDGGVVQVLWIDVRTPDAPSGACGGRPSVDLELRPWRVRVSTEHPGDNVLPLARDALGTAWPQVPAALRALNPGLSLRYERAGGATIGLTLQSPLPALASGLETRLDLERSIAEPLHDNHAALHWQSGPGLLAGAPLRVRLDLQDRRRPLGSSVMEERRSELGAGVTIKLTPTRRLWLDTAWQSHEDRRIDGAVPGPAQRQNAWAQRVLFDGLQAESLTAMRGAVWHERRDGATRLAGRFGLAREWRIQPGHLLGLEAELSLGHAGSATPDERRFRGGAPTAQWLYDSPAAPALNTLPAGPSLRSFGQTQAQLASGPAARGGTRFWGLQLTAAFPVARWYRPLIPDETTDLEGADGRALSLKQLLMRQVDVTGPNLLAATLAAQGVPPAEAQAQARAALGEVRPAVRYLVEDAPILALRPVLMLDAAGLADGSSHARWIAIGAGAQLQMATARAETGYMRTVSGPLHGGARGAFVFRLTFQNLF
jgi:hypothetical protein